MTIGLATIVLVGLSANYPNPGVFVEIDFAQGPVAGSGSPRTAIFYGNKTAAGTATNDTVIYGPDTQTPCQTENDVINLFGTGSQLHRMYLKFTAINKTTSIYYIAVTSSAGAAAAITETIATTALSNGNHRTWVGSDFVDTPITIGDTATVIAGNVVTSVNSQTRWGVTAANVAGVITYTAKEPGPEGNWTKVQALITPTTATIGTTTTLTANTLLSGGTTADNVTNALATSLSGRYFYQVIGDSDATNIGRVVTQINTQATATVGLRGSAFAGSSDTLANGITVATGLNAPRCEIIWGNATDWTPAELAANNAALYALLENGAAVGVARKNFSLFPSQPNDPQYWVVPGGRGGAAGSPTNVQITSALNNGLTPVITLPSGNSQLVKRITTRSLNGSTADYRIRDAHRRVICDFWGDDAAAITQLNFGGKDILANPLPGQSQTSPYATTPQLWGNALKALVESYDAAGQWAAKIPGVSAADAINNAAIIQQEVSPPNRMSALFGLQPCDIFDQAAVLVLQL